MNVNSKSEKSIGAYLYPTRILIVTKNKKDNFIRYTTDKFSELPINISDVQLGQIVLDHLKISSELPASTEDIKTLWKNFLKLAKFRNEKAFMQDAKYVNIVKVDELLTLEPWKNRVSQRTFYRNPDFVIRFNSIPVVEVIGQSLKKSWGHCLFIE